jgi:hypothetical protein
MNSPIPWLAVLLPGAEVETIPSWLYFVGPMITMMMGALATTVIAHYRKVQRGDLVPKRTVDFVVATKDAEIAHLQTEVDRWVGVYHIADSAYKELAQSIDENTDAMRAVVDRAIGPARSGNSNAEATVVRRRERA